MKQVRDQVTSFKTSADLHFRDTKKTLTEHKQAIKEIINRVDTKAERTDLEAFQAELKKFPLKEDFRELYEKVVPVMKRYDMTLTDYSTENAKTAEIIRQFDENLSQKAQKSQISTLEATLRKYVTKVDLATAQAEEQMAQNVRNKEIASLWEEIDT